MIHPAPYQNCLPPAPRGVEFTFALESLTRHFDEAVSRFNADIIGSAKATSARLASVVDALGKAREMFNTLIHYKSISMRSLSMTAYAAAGHPYGKNHRGRARWEMARRRKER